MDNALLQRLPIQSISDQEEYRRLAVIAANCATSVGPEQQAVWSYPMQAGDLEETRMNMVNAMLLRIHQSGHLADLSAERFGAVVAGIAVFKRIRHEIRSELPSWPIGVATFGCPFAVSALRDGSTMLVAVWRFQTAEEELEIPGEISRFLGGCRWHLALEGLIHAIYNSFRRRGSPPSDSSRRINPLICIRAAHPERRIGTLRRDCTSLSHETRSPLHAA